MASGHLHLNYPSDSAGRASFTGSPFQRNSPGSFEVIHQAMELAKKRVACECEESVTALTSTIERALPAISPEVASEACGQVRRGAPRS